MCMGKVKPLKFVKKHPLEAVALAGLAATGAGAAGFGPMAGLMAGNPAGAAAGIAGGTLGNEVGGMTASQIASSGLGQGGGMFGGLTGKDIASKVGKFGQAAKVAGLLNPQQQGPMGSPPPQYAPSAPTNLAQQGLFGTPPSWGAVGGNEDERLRAIMAMLQQRQGAA
jgi:hypothetical protein